MILYLDTSSLVKLYVSEEGTSEVTRLVEQADVVASSVVAFPETRSAFARLAREGDLTRDQLASVRKAFALDWESFLKIRVLKRIYRRAGDLAEEHELRGFDSLHLASFQEVLVQAKGEPVAFSAYDVRLSAAAAALQSGEAS